MNLPSTQSGAEVELRLKVLGFEIQPSHQASALNEIERVSGTGGAAIVNRVGGQATQTQSVGSMPRRSRFINASLAACKQVARQVERLYLWQRRTWCWRSNLLTSPRLQASSCFRKGLG